MGTSAIIAAYNEEKTIAEVLTALTRNRLIDEIIVVSDGITTDGEKLSAAARHARQKSVPLYTVAVGNADHRSGKLNCLSEDRRAGEDEREQQLRKRLVNRLATHRGNPGMSI